MFYVNFLRFISSSVNDLKKNVILKHKNLNKKCSRRLLYFYKKIYCFSFFLERAAYYSTNQKNIFLVCALFIKQHTGNKQTLHKTNLNSEKPFEIHQTPKGSNHLLKEL